MTSSRPAARTSNLRPTSRSQEPAASATASPRSRHTTSRFATGSVPTAKPRRVDVVAWILALLTVLMYLGFAWFQWANFSSPSWDLGIFTQLADRYAHLEAPIVDIKEPGFNLWGDHFHPILLLTGPLFRLFPSGMTLMALEAFLFGISVAPITAFARRRIGRLAGTIVGVAYAVSWGLTSASVVQFHEIAFAVPLLTFGLTHWLDGRRRAALVEIGLLVFVKEDLGLTVAAIGFVIFLEALQSVRGSRGSDDAALANAGATEPATTNVSAANASGDDAASPRTVFAAFWRHVRAALATRDGRIAVGLAVWGIFWFALATFVILPHFNPNGDWDYASRLNSQYGFFQPEVKWETLGFTVTALGALGLLSPWSIALIPTFLWRFSGNNPYYWTILWHYSATLMPIIAVALVDGAERWHRHSHPLRLRAGQSSARSHPVRGQAPRWAASSLMSVASALLFLGSSLVGTSYNGFGHWVTGQGNTQGYVSVAGYGDAQTPAERAAARGAVAAVGTGRTLIADVVMMAYVVPGNTVYWEHSYGDAYFDTVVFSNRLYHGSGSNVVRWVKSKVGGSWHVVYNRLGYVVVERDGT